VTGDYGTGKSSFALALAHLLRHDGREIPAELRKCVDFRALGLERPNLLPVLVTGTRASLSSSLRTSLAKALEDECRRGKPPQIIAKLRETPANSVDQSGTEDIKLIGEAVEFLRQSGKADGLVIILDELGKFLEFAALYPERQDIYLLQMLAESAARSADTPIFVVGSCHSPLRGNGTRSRGDMKRFCSTSRSSRRLHSWQAP
jgi:energy-coupling factor transporter ATP-binding protein EcfA2